MKLESMPVLENAICQTQNFQTNFKAVIFDCDGTLIDSEYSHYLAWQYAMQRQGSDLDLDEYYFFVGKSSEVISKLLAQRVGKDCSDEILSDKRFFYQSLQSPPIASTINFVRCLANEKNALGIKLGVVRC